MPGALAQTINTRLRPLPDWPLYGLAVLPPAWLLWQGLTGGLGPDPVKAMEHQMGLWGLQVLIASLAVTPVRRFTGVSLLKFRRALGLIGFAYILLHLMVWLALDFQFFWGEIWADIVKRPYITVGMAGFALLIPLAATSWTGAIRRMGGAAWQRLHRLAYPAILLGGVHYLWLVKGWQAEPILYLAGIVGLLLLRLRPSRWQRPLRWASDSR